MNKVYSFALAAMVFAAMMQGCPENKKPVESKSASGNIIVYQPHPNDTITSPVTVAGKARVFEAAASTRVLSSDGRQLGIAHFMASRGAPDFGDFSAKVSFQVPAGVTQGIVEVYDNSAKDGSVIDLVRIPVRFGNQ